MTFGVSSDEWSSTMIHSQSSAFPSVRDRIFSYTAGRLRASLKAGETTLNMLSPISPLARTRVCVQIYWPRSWDTTWGTRSRGDLGPGGYFRMFGRGN